MIHPSSFAVDYVWECFQNSLLDPKEQTLRKKLSKLQRAIGHKPLHSESSTHQQFIQAQLSTIETLSKKYPYLPLNNAHQFFRSQLDIVS